MVFPHFFFHIFVWGSCFLVVIPVRLLLLRRLLLSPPPCPRIQFVHMQLTHIQLVHSPRQLTNIQLTYIQLTHTYFIRVDQVLNCDYKNYEEDY